jgi:hypothetical protein
MDPFALVSSIISDTRTLHGLGRDRVDDILSLLDICFQELSQGSWPLVDVPDNGSDIYIAGDIHGDLTTARRITDPLLIEPSPGSGSAPILIFLGDYVDRPPRDVPEGGLLTALYLLSLRIAYPDNVILLRGNHEGADLTSFSPCDLPEEIETRFGTDRSKEVYSAFLRTFSAMPLMARTASGVLCTHASFPREKDPSDMTPQDREDIMRTLWGDPVVKGHDFLGRGMGYEFDEDDLDTFLDRIGSRILVRGHDPPLQGIPLFHDRMVTITSSRIYQRQGIGGVFMLRSGGRTPPMVVKDLQLLDIKGDRIEAKEWRDPGLSQITPPRHPPGASSG